MKEAIRYIKTIIDMNNKDIAIYAKFSNESEFESVEDIYKYRKLEVENANKNLEKILEMLGGE